MNIKQKKILTFIIIADEIKKNKNQSKNKINQNKKNTTLLLEKIWSL